MRTDAAMPEPLRKSALAGRKQPYGWAWIGSIAFHGLLVGGVVAATLLGDRAPDLSQQPIQAKLVRLGKPRPDNWLPRKPTAPPVPQTTQTAPVPTPGAQSAPLPPAPEAKPQPETKPDPVPAKAAPTPTGPSTAAGAPKDAKVDQKSKLDDIMKRFQKGAVAGPAEELPGQLDGDPDGDSEDGSEGERYYALLTKRFKENFLVPNTISDQERMYLKATVSVRIEANGSISSWKIVQGSGNAAFDSALEAAVKRSSPVPPPPANLASQLRSGISLIFKPF